MPKSQKNPYGFDHKRKHAAFEQLQKLVNMQEKNSTFQKIKQRIQSISRKKLDRTEMGKNQEAALLEIENLLKDEFSLLFGDLVPNQSARLYYARQCVLSIHRRDRRASIIGSKAEEQKGDVYSASTPSTRADLTQSGRLQSAPPTLPSSTRLMNGFSQPRESLPPLKERTVQDDVEMADRDEDQVVQSPPEEQAASGSRNSISCSEDTRLIENTDEVGEPSVIETYPTPLAEPGIARSDTLTIKSRSQSVDDRSREAGEEELELEQTIIEDFLQTYACPPMVDFMAEFIRVGIRNLKRLRGIAQWTPEDRLQLFETLSPEPCELAVTPLEIHTLERAFILYGKAM